MAESQRAARAAARAAAQKAQADAWLAQADAYFSFLRTKYVFHIAQADASSVWQTDLVYESQTAAVRVSRSVEFDRVEVELMRLVDGKLPEHPIFVLPDTVINDFLLDNLLILRAPHVLDELAAAKGLQDAQIVRSLEHLARAVEQYADDILRGDFTVFAAVEDLIKQRAREHPQVITVWIPEDAEPGAEATTAEEAQRDWPQIPVVVRRYRRPTNRKRQSADAQEQPG